MPKAKTASFTTEFELQSNSKDQRVLGSRFEAAVQIYNAILHESLRRLDRMRLDPGFDLAAAMPRGATGPQATAAQKDAAKAQDDAFDVLREKYGFRAFDLHKHASLSAGCWLRGHLDSQVAQVVATRAFRAAEQHCFDKGGRPRVKDHGEIDSLEGKSNKSGIRYRFRRIEWKSKFAMLDLPLVVKPGDPVQAHALRLAEAGKVKFVRLLFRTIRGQRRVCAQLVLEGQPWVKLTEAGEPKHRVAQGVVGAMDLGISHVAVVTQGHVKTFPFCEGLDSKIAEIQRYQRRKDRQRRAKNPLNFHVDGTVREGQLVWDKSEGQKRVEVALADLCRATAAQRLSLQNHLAHQVLSLANVLISEKVDKRGWAKLFGRTVGHTAPAMFEDRVGILAKASGGDLELVCTYKTFLSSRCLCGQRKKKTLKNRKHTCGCRWVPKGAYVDRDQFSAFLAMFCQGGALDERRARTAWSEWGADSLLRSSSKKRKVAPGVTLVTR
jgi:putative transposase